MKPNHIHGIIITNNPCLAGRQAVGTGHALSVNENIKNNNLVEEALLNGEILEQYPNTGRGETCLIIGFADDVPIHVVCGWRGEKATLITVYIPRPPKFIDPWTRGGES